MRLPGKTILIVDDDAALRVLLRKILENTGCEVVEAESVRVAIQRIEAKLPDLIVLDLSMPEHDGFTFLKVRGASKVMRAIPVLVLSSSAAPSVVEKALALGANQFLDKPLRANLVLQKIRHLFYSAEVLSYTFPEGKELAVNAEVKGEIAGISENQVKVCTPVKFSSGVPLHMKLESFIRAGGWEVVARIDNRQGDFSGGVYAQHATFMGMTPEEKKKFLDWVKTV